MARALARGLLLLAGALARGCTPEETQRIRDSIPELHTATSCPIATWKPAIFRSEGIQKRSSPVVVFDIGCNKGFDALETLNVLTQNFTVTHDLWRDAAHWLQCGQCHQCESDSKPDAGMTPQKVHLYCVEPLPVNYRRLHHTAEELGLAARGLHVVHAAFTSLSDAEASNWTAPFPDPQHTAAMVSVVGHEAFGLNGVGQKFCKHCKTAPVPLDVLDGFAARHQLQYVDLLSIDAEGNDAAILQSGHATLRVTRYLEFEYHGRGVWARTNLSDVVHELHVTFGFVCYWAGRGKLWRITGCWHPDYEFHQWSNVACVKETETEWYAIMEAVFRETTAEK